MTQYLILLLLFILGWKNPIAQPSQPSEKTNHLQISTGYNHSLVKDLLMSPLHYREGGLIYGLDYTRFTEKGLFQAKLNYSTGQTHTRRFPLLNTDYQLGNLDLSLLRKLFPDSENKWDVFLGGRYHFHIFYLDWQGQQAFSFLATHSLDIEGKVTYEPHPRYTLSASLAMPLYTLIVRPPYNGYDEELDNNFEQGKIFKLITDGSWGFWDKLFMYDLALGLEYRISDSFDLTADYLNAFYRTGIPDAYRRMQNQLMLGINWKF